MKKLISLIVLIFIFISILLQGNVCEAFRGLLQGDDLTMGCLQCQAEVHLLLGLSAAVAGMVCRARGGS